MLDLHRAIIQPLRSRIDMAAVWRRARPAVERDDGGFRLDPVDEALFHMVHLARHELWAPLVSYADASRLLRRLNQGQKACLRRRARRYRLSRAVASATAMTRALCVGANTCSGGDAIRRLVLPGPAEVLDCRRPPRARQLLRKLVLLEGPAELAGLAAVVLLEQVAARRGSGH
jgi:hypothetical protein